MAIKILPGPDAEEAIMPLLSVFLRDVYLFPPDGLPVGKSFLLSEALPVYIVELGAVGSGRFLESSDLLPFRWRSLVLSLERNPLISVDIDHAGRLLEINDGPSVGELLGRLLVVEDTEEELPALHAGDYEVRLIDIPSIYIRSVWLFSLSSLNSREFDIFFPLQPIFLDVLRPKNWFWYSEFVNAAVGAAARRLTLGARA